MGTRLKSFLQQTRMSRKSCVLAHNGVNGLYHQFFIIIIYYSIKKLNNLYFDVMILNFLGCHCDSSSDVSAEPLSENTGVHHTDLLPLL